MRFNENEAPTENGTEKFQFEAALNDPETVSSGRIIYTAAVELEHTQTHQL